MYSARYLLNKHDHHLTESVTHRHPSNSSLISKWKIAALAVTFVAIVCIYATYFAGLVPTEKSVVAAYHDHQVDIINKTLETAVNHRNILSIVNGTKTILMASKWYWGMRFHDGRYGFVDVGCEVNNCVLTKNHTFVPNYQFDAFLIHLPTERKDLWTFPNRTDNQIFVLFSTEPPGITVPL